MYNTRGAHCPLIPKIFRHSSFASRELLVKFPHLHRKCETQKEKKGTICPPEGKISYVKVYRCPLIPNYVAFLGNKGTTGPPD